MLRSLWIAPLMAAACAKDPGPQGGGPGLAAPPKPGAMRVGNQVEGVEAQPDYDAEAEQIRQRVDEVMPRPLPSPQAACTTMLDAAVAMYRRVDGEGARSVSLLEATRETDLAACEEQTSPEAAACVAILISGEGGEFAWLLDQCSRAYPS